MYNHYDPYYQNKFSPRLIVPILILFFSRWVFQSLSYFGTKKQNSYFGLLWPVLYLAWWAIRTQYFPSRCWINTSPEVVFYQHLYLIMNIFFVRFGIRNRVITHGKQRSCHWSHWTNCALLYYLSQKTLFKN